MAKTKTWSRWTEQQKKAMKVMLKQGLPYDFIAMKFNKTQPAIESMATRMFAKSPKRKGCRWTDEEKQKAVTLRQSGYSVKEIAKKLQRTKVGVEAQLYAKKYLANVADQEIDIPAQFIQWAKSIGAKVQICFD